MRQLQNGVGFCVFRGFWLNGSSIVSKEWAIPVQRHCTLTWNFCFWQLLPNKSRWSPKSVFVQHSMEQVWMKTTETGVTDFVPPKDHCRQFRPSQNVASSILQSQSFLFCCLNLIIALTQAAVQPGPAALVQGATQCPPIWLAFCLWLMQVVSNPGYAVYIIQGSIVQIVYVNSDIHAFDIMTRTP